MLPILLIILCIVFFFGYDYSLFAKDKMKEFIQGMIGITLLFIIFSFIKYPNKKYVPLCNKCHTKIKNIKSDCEITNIELVGTYDKTVYEKKRSKIKGKTTYPRGGYSMRVSEYEYKSESTYEVEEDIPVLKNAISMTLLIAVRNVGNLLGLSKKKALGHIKE